MKIIACVKKGIFNDFALFFEAKHEHFRYFFTTFASQKIEIC